MSISQANGYEAVFELSDGTEATLPVVVWINGIDLAAGLVNQSDLEALLGKRFNTGHRDLSGLMTPHLYPEFQRYRKTGCDFGERPQS